MSSTPPLMKSLVDRMRGLRMDQPLHPLPSPPPPHEIPFFRFPPPPSNPPRVLSAPAANSLPTTTDPDLDPEPRPSGRVRRPPSPSTLLRQEAPVAATTAGGGGPLPTDEVEASESSVVVPLPKTGKKRDRERDTELRLSGSGPSRKRRKKAADTAREETLLETEGDPTILLDRGFSRNPGQRRAVGMPLDTLPFALPFFLPAQAYPLVSRLERENGRRFAAIDRRFLRDSGGVGDKVLWIDPRNVGRFRLYFEFEGCFAQFETTIQVLLSQVGTFALRFSEVCDYSESTDFEVATDARLSVEPDFLSNRTTVILSLPLDGLLEKAKTQRSSGKLAQNAVFKVRCQIGFGGAKRCVASFPLIARRRKFRPRRYRGDPRRVVSRVTEACLCVNMPVSIGPPVRGGGDEPSRDVVLLCDSESERDFESESEYSESESESDSESTDCESQATAQSANKSDSDAEFETVPTVECCAGRRDSPETPGSDSEVAVSAHETEDPTAPISVICVDTRNRNVQILQSETPISVSSLCDQLGCPVVGAFLSKGDDNCDPEALEKSLPCLGHWILHYSRSSLTIVARLLSPRDSRESESDSDLPKFVVSLEIPARAFFDRIRSIAMYDDIRVFLQDGTELEECGYPLRDCEDDSEVYLEVGRRFVAGDTSHDVLDPATSVFTVKACCPECDIILFPFKGNKFWALDKLDRTCPNCKERETVFNFLKFQHTEFKVGSSRWRYAADSEWLRPAFFGLPNFRQPGVVVSARDLDPKLREVCGETTFEGLQSTYSKICGVCRHPFERGGFVQFGCGHRVHLGGDCESESCRLCPQQEV